MNLRGRYRDATLLIWMLALTFLHGPQASHAEQLSAVSFRERMTDALSGRNENKVHAVQNALRIAHDEKRLSLLTRFHWQTMQSKLQCFRDNQLAGNSTRAEVVNVAGTNAIVEFALGNNAVAVEYLRKESIVSKKSTSELAMLLTNQWMRHVNDDVAKHCLRVAVDELINASPEKRIETLKDLNRFAFEHPELFKGVWSPSDVDQLLRSLPPGSVSEMFWYCPAIFSGSGSIIATGQRQLSAATNDDEKLLIAARMLQSAPSFDQISEILKAEKPVEFVVSSSRLDVLQAAAMVRMYAGRFLLNENQLAAAIERLDDAKSRFDIVLRAMRTTPDTVRFRWERFRLDVDQYLAVASFLNEDYERAQRQFEQVTAEVRKLRRQISSERFTDLERQVLMPSLDRIEYASAIGFAQVHVSRHEWPDANLYLSELASTLTDDVVNELSVGLRLQQAKIHTVVARFYLSNLTLDLNALANGKFDQSVGDAGQLILNGEKAASIANSLLRNGEAKLSRFETVWAREIRGTAGFYLLAKPGLSDNPDVVASIQDDLQFAATSYQSMADYRSRACTPMVLLAHLTSAKDPQQAIETLNQALELSNQANRDILGIDILLSRAMVRMDQGDLVGCEADRQRARERIVDLSSTREMDWESVGQAFNATIITQLERASSEPSTAKSSLVKAIGAMWLADELADRGPVDEDKSSNSDPAIEPDVVSPNEVSEWLEQKMESDVTTVIFRSTTLATYRVALGKNVGADRFLIAKLPIGRRDLQTKVSDLLVRLSENPKLASQETEPAQSLIDQLSGFGTILLPEQLLNDGKTIELIRHGALSRIPFHCLFASREKLPTFRSIVWSNKVDRSGGEIDSTRYVGLGIRDFGLYISESILNAEPEVVGFSKRFGERRVRRGTAADATWTNLIDDIRWGQQGNGKGFVMHLATHGTTKGNLPAIRLQDKDVKAAEISRQDLGGCQLAILSSCRSNHVGTNLIFGNGVTIASAFLRAGADEVIASCWDANDEATSRVIEAFGEAKYGGGKPISTEEALTQAIDSLRSEKEFSHPFFWAPFVVIGR
ncbi:MAG: CHAT domain-containing protein [Pirellulaceae bacterium]